MARERETSAQPWGTLEELLLASAVNRHGTKSWDSIALELQSRRTFTSSSSSSSSSLFPSFTPQLCKDKFFDLKRRFISPNDAASSSSSTLVDQLRRIRVEELRREVQQRDVSIVSLELKVKRLVEERERSLKEEADLNDRQNKLSPDIVAGEPTAGNDSGDIDDRSFNESNSTSQKPDEATTTTTTNTVKDEQNDVEAVEEVRGEKKAQVKTEPVEPDARNEADPVRTGKGPGNERVNAEERDNKKQTSDVQSSASLSKKKRRRVSSEVGSSSGEEREGDEVSPAKKRASAVKPESFVRLLGIIRSHRLGSAFGRRQRSQESERYKNLIRQHMDLKKIESRLDKGIYSSDSSPKFFRDILLLFNNIIVFHRKNSPEHIAAQELRALVLKEINDKFRKHPATSKAEPDDVPPASLSKPSKSSTIAACSKRSSVKESSENNSRRGDKKGRKVEEKPKANEKKVGSNYFAGIDDKGIRKKRSKERAVPGRRNSSRTSTKSGETKHEYGGNELSSHDTLELKVDKKEKNIPKKKQGAASFLKRMKQSSPSEVTEKDDDEDEEDDDESEEESKEEKGRGRNKREVKRVTRSSGGRGAREESGRAKRGVGRPPKRAAAAAETTGKRGRENAENGGGSGGRARKRSRR